METGQTWWLEEKVDGWWALLAIMAGLEGKHPQTDYTGLHNSLQQEWYFLQYVTLDIGTAF